VIWERLVIAGIDAWHGASVREGRGVRIKEGLPVESLSI
jgi:hypothetical protein